MAPLSYLPVFLTIASVFSAVIIFQYIASPDYRFQMQKNSLLMPCLLCFVLVFWLGGRPVSGAVFGDMVNYALSYAGIDPTASVLIDWHSEWIWPYLAVICKNIGLNVHGYFIVIEAGYIFSALWAVKRFVPNNPMLGLLFVLMSLMFFSFGTNGLRNGLACHIMLLAMSYFFDDKYLVGGLLCLIAFGLHRSTILPIAGMLAGRFVIKDLRYAILFWFSSIVISLVVGNAVSVFLASLGFDDRMASYNTTEFAALFSRTGFRWDFLFYSIFPILMGWYVCVKKQIKDDWYRTLCVSYCLCNAFWVMVIRAAFSNRFAYLSWFMYPIIIVYPLVNLPVWEDQDRKTAMILAVYCSFTLIMQLVYWR